MINSLPQYLTVPQVMDTLQVSNDIVYGLIKQGKLRAAKVGKVFRISEQELQRYLDSVTGGDGDE